MKFDVHVRGKRVAQLYRESDEYALKYLPEATDFTSLTMPVREASWNWPRDLHPFFRQNLPEGFLLNIVREDFGRHLDGTDLSLLALVGGSGIGRVTVTPEGTAPGVDLEPLQLESLLKSETSPKKFAQLVRQYARAAISGAVPKFIAPEEGAGRTTATGKITLRAGRHIVQGSDEKTPFLGFNEFHTMRVLERLNVVPVAKTRMSDDGNLLIVDRFDLDEAGAPAFGVEDACSLLGLPPHEKYAPSMEQVVNATRAYLPSGSRAAQLKSLGWLIITNYVVRNADCHSKNIALYYTSTADVAYTPAYDIVTTQAYPRYADNPPGLSIEGRKSWAPGKSLETFFKARLGIAPRDYAQMAERVCESAVEVGREMIAAAKAEPRWHGIAKQMAYAWDEGMASLRSTRRDSKYRGLKADIEAAGFSELDPPDRPERVGRSKLMGRPKRRK
ncbi:MAG: type II toxin-antitoxin system HipA family toxin [Pseudomonadota bacterium]